MDEDTKEFREDCKWAADYLLRLSEAPIEGDPFEGAAKKDIHEHDIDKVFITLGEVFLAHWGLNTDLNILIQQIVSELAEEILGYEAKAD